MLKYDLTINQDFSCLELECYCCYEKNHIINKINAFFGYDCITQITLKIVNEKLKTIKNKFSKIKDPSKIKDKMEKVNNINLKSSLNNFLKAFNEKY